jgi:hypothetical protein
MKISCKKRRYNGEETKYKSFAANTNTIIVSPYQFSKELALVIPTLGNFLHR